MPKFSANLTMLFNEVSFLDRFALASAAGFTGIEYMFPYAFDKEEQAERLDRYGLEMVLHNLPAGDWSAGERGTACIPDRVEEFREGVGRGIEYAKALGCTRLNCLAGNTPEGVSPGKVRRTMVDNLRFAAAALEKEGISLLFEALNIHDMPGYYLVHTQDALQLLEEVGHPNLWLQYDVYHMQVMEGNLIKTMLDHLARIAHIQIADNPGRHEPGTGEINFENIFNSIDEAGYSGWIGCEYNPSGLTIDSFGWVKNYLRRGDNKNG